MPRQLSCREEEEEEDGIPDLPPFLLLDLCARRTDSNFQRPLLHGQKGPKRLEAVAECFINEQTWGRLHDLPAETLTGAALPPSPARVGHLCEYPRLCPGWSSHSRAGLF